MIEEHDMSSYRIDFFKSIILKNAVSKQSIVNLGYPEIFASFFIEKFANNSFIIARWIKEILDDSKSFFDDDPFYFGLINGFNNNAKEEMNMYLASQKGRDFYYNYLKERGFEVDYKYSFEEEKDILVDDLRKSFNKSVKFKRDLIKQIHSGKITNISEYKKLNYNDASMKYMDKNIGNEKNTIISYHDGYRWVDFGKSCDWLGRKMKNCGSSGLTGLSFDSRMLALLDENNKPHVILTDNTDISTVSSIQGAASSSPKEKYHNYIIDLIKELNLKFDLKTNKSISLYIDFIFQDLDLEKELVYKGTWKDIYKLTVGNRIFYSDGKHILDNDSTIKAYEFLDLKDDDGNKESLQNSLTYIFSGAKFKYDQLSEELGIEFYDISNEESAKEYKDKIILKLGYRLIEILKISKKKDPKKGTGKKPKGSGRRLYTDENPKDTCSVSFTSASAIRKTFSSSCFKSKSHARQSQIINLVHQRVRAAHKNAKDPKVKKRLKRALEYAEKRKESSKKKTERLKKNKKRSHLISDIYKFAIEESKKLNSKLAAIIENPNFMKEYLEEKGEEGFYTYLESMFGKPIGEGGSRLAYAIDDFILKIAKVQNGSFVRSGLNGNRKEGELYFKYPEFLPIALGFDNNGSWIIQERLVPFEAEEEFVSHYLSTFNSSNEIKNFLQSLGYSENLEIIHQCYVAYERSYIYGKDFLNDAKSLFLGYYKITNEDFKKIQSYVKGLLEKDEKFLKYLEFIKESKIRLGEIGQQNSGYDKSGNFKIFDLSH